MSTHGHSFVLSSLVALAAVPLLSLAPGCRKADDAVIQKLDEISHKLDKLDALERQLAGAPNRAGAARPRERAAQPGRPDPNAVYAVPIEGAPFDGKPHAKVTIVEAFEFACPFCDRVRPTIAQLEQEYGDDLKVVYKNYVVHPQVATVPAHAACAAHAQGKYKQMHDLIWEKGFKANRNLGADNMLELAAEAKLDVGRFEADMNGDACKRQVQTEQAQLAAVGTRGTPAFYINGRFLSGAQPIERFKAIVDEELQKANARIERGAKLERYYDDFVLKAGKAKL